MSVTCLLHGRAQCQDYCDTATPSDDASAYFSKAAATQTARTEAASAPEKVAFAPCRSLLTDKTNESRLVGVAVAVVVAVAADTVVAGGGCGDACLPLPPRTQPSPVHLRQHRNNHTHELCNGQVDVPRMESAGDLKTLVSEPTQSTNAKHKNTCRQSQQQQKRHTTREHL